MNWGQLKAAVIAYTKRSDLAAMFPTFLELAEQRIYWGAPESDVPPLRLSTMLKTVNPASATLPADFVEMKRICAVMSPTLKKPLDFKPVENMGEQETASGAPTFYSLQGSSIIYSPTFSQPVELIYYGKFGTLSADSDSNWLSENASSVYLAALLIEVHMWSFNDAELAKAIARFASAANALQAQDDGNKHSGAQLRIMQDSRRLI